MNKDDAAKLADEIGKLRTEKADTEAKIKLKQDELITYFKARGISVIEGTHYRAKQQDSTSTSWNALAITAVAAEAKVPLETLKSVSSYSFIRTDALRKA